MASVIKIWNKSVNLRVNKSNFYLSNLFFFKYFFFSGIMLGISEKELSEISLKFFLLGKKASMRFEGQPVYYCYKRIS